ncbi:MAG: ribbon-helix-helix domain-containing protein [Spirochaetaceae bacterium]|jgi:metal-responsive CopG/Arc/MetJ family transcriptional regulator|nr:ribbon-helix-helix domain-containing protein [Spirochaetaceae bacterium]
MVTKTKKSISLSNTLLNELTQVNGYSTISEFIENAVSFYIKELKRVKRVQHDIEILNAKSKELNEEALENLEFQDIL